jgi:hypothetical protein
MTVEHRINYPMAETFKDHLFSDTIRIQNLIWLICFEIMVASYLSLGELYLISQGALG